MTVPNGLKRLAIILWFLPFMISMMVVFILDPLIWAISGHWGHDWLFEHAEPFELAEKWGLTKE